MAQDLPVYNLCFKGERVPCLHGTNYCLSTDCSNYIKPLSWLTQNLVSKPLSFILPHGERLNDEKSVLGRRRSTQNSGGRPSWLGTLLVIQLFCNIGDMTKVSELQFYPLSYGDDDTIFLGVVARMRIKVKFMCLSEVIVPDTWQYIFQGVPVAVLLPTKGNPLFFKYLSIWLCRVLVAAHRIFNLCWAFRILSFSMQTLSCDTWDLVLWPGIEPRLPALGAQSLSCWITREFPKG